VRERERDFAAVGGLLPIAGDRDGGRREQREQLLGLTGRMEYGRRGVQLREREGVAGLVTTQCGGCATGRVGGADAA
jgi:hypothetical protein